MRSLYHSAITSAFVLLSLPCFSQNSHFSKGQVTVQAGIGFLSTLDNTDDYGNGLTYPLTLPPLSVVADVGITDAISIGLYLASAKSDVYYQDISQKIKLGSLSHFIFAVRGLYHFAALNSFDTYGGAMLGYNAISATGYDNSVGKQSALTYGVLVGARYPFTKAFGAFLELGYGVAAINLGLALKIK